MRQEISVTQRRACSRGKKGRGLRDTDDAGTTFEKKEEGGITLMGPWRSGRRGGDLRSERGGGVLGGGWWWWGGAFPEVRNA